MYLLKTWSKFRHLKGWAAFNSALDVGFACMGWHDNALSLKDDDKEVNYAVYDKTLNLMVQAPLNLDVSKVEKASITLKSSDGIVSVIELSGEAANGFLFNAEIAFSKSQKRVLYSFHKEAQ